MRFIRISLFLCAVVICAADCLAQGAPGQDKWSEKFNSSGAKLTYKQTGREFAGGRTVLTYNLFATGLPRDQKYVLWTWGITTGPRAIADAYLNGDGKVVNVRADREAHVNEDPIDLRISGAKGEPVRFALVSADGTLHAFTRIIPFPMEKDSGACHLSVIELAPNYAGVQMVVTGLQPEEAVKIAERSGDEGGSAKGVADAEGVYNAAVFPVLKGKQSGKARFELDGQSCKIAIDFSWGEGTQNAQ